MGDLTDGIKALTDAEVLERVLSNIASPARDELRRRFATAREDARCAHAALAWIQKQARTAQERPGESAKALNDIEFRAMMCVGS